MNHKQEGQTLIIIIFVMILALAIGVTISNRLISSLSSTTQTIISYRAKSVAEAALERVLALPVSVLEDYIENGTCGEDCILTLENDDGIIETAEITLSYLGNTSGPYTIKIEENMTTEVNLDSYPSNKDLTLCWNGNINPKPAVVGGLVYGTLGNYNYESFAVNSFNSSYSNGFINPFSDYGFDSCYKLNSNSAPQILRLRALYNSIEISVYPQAGLTIPYQGIEIVSQGRVKQSIHTIKAVKSTNFLPAVFDYTIYNKSNEDTFTN